MKVSIKEVFDDLYKLAEEEGYFSAICEHCELKEADLKEYHENVLEICSKYIPNYEKFLPERYYNENASWDEKGLMLSQLAEENFREIIYGLMYQGGNKQ